MPRWQITLNLFHINRSLVSELSPFHQPHNEMSNSILSAEKIVLLEACPKVNSRDIRGHLSAINQEQDFRTLIGILIY